MSDDDRVANGEASSEARCEASDLSEAEEVCILAATWLRHGSPAGGLTPPSHSPPPRSTGPPLLLKIAPLTPLGTAS